MDEPVYLTNMYKYKSSDRNTDGSTVYQTDLLAEENVGGPKFAYTYDKVGNITEIKRNGADYHSYTYDKSGQLLRDNSYTSGGGTFVWEYDSLGNI